MVVAVYLFSDHYHRQAARGVGINTTHSPPRRFTLLYPPLCLTISATAPLLVSSSILLVCSVPPSCRPPVSVFTLPASTVSTPPRRHLIESVGTIDLLILDSLYESRSHNTHLSIREALDVCRALKPVRTLLVGCSDEFEHHAKNAELKLLKASEGLDVQVAHDGLYVDIQLQ